MKNKILPLVFTVLLLASACNSTNTDTQKEASTKKECFNSRAKAEAEKPAEQEISLDTGCVIGINYTPVGGNANGSYNARQARIVNKNGEEYTLRGHNDLFLYTERGDIVVVRTFMQPELKSSWDKHTYETEYFYEMQQAKEITENLTANKIKENWLNNQINNVK